MEVFLKSYSLKLSEVPDSTILSLSKKQKSRLSNSINQKVDSISKFLKSEALEEYEQKINQSEYSALANKLLVKSEMLLSIFDTSLVLTLNNYQNQKVSFNEFLNQLREDNIDLKHFTQKKIEEYYFEHDKSIYEYISTSKNYLEFTKENINWSLAYYQLYKSEGIFTFLDYSVKLLQSCRNYFMRFSCDSKFVSGQVPYTSNTRFCSFTQFKRAKDLRFQIYNTLSYYENEGYTHSFLTIAPRNIENITKSDYEILCKVMFYFWRHPTIKKVFKGYFGVEEAKEKQNSFNVHFHFLVLRKVEFKEGYLKQEIISDIFREVCDRYGNEKIKGSFRVDIRAPNLYDEDKRLGAVKYILQYLSKGCHMQSLKGRKEYILATIGMRKYRAGGFLASKFQKNIAVKQEVLSKLQENEQVLEHFSKHSIKATINKIDIQKPTREYSFGGKQLITKKGSYLLSEPLKINSDIFALKSLFGKSPKQIADSIGFHFSNQVRQTLFAKKKFVCRFTGQSLDYKGIKNTKEQTDPSNIIFQYFALEQHFLSGKIKLPKDHYLMQFKAQYEAQESFISELTTSGQYY